MPNFCEKYSKHSKLDLLSRLPLNSGSIQKFSSLTGLGTSQGGDEASFLTHNRFFVTKFTFLTPRAEFLKMS